MRESGWESERRKEGEESCHVHLRDKKNLAKNQSLFCSVRGGSVVFRQAFACRFYSPFWQSLKIWAWRLHLNRFSRVHWRLWTATIDKYKSTANEKHDTSSFGRFCIALEVYSLSFFLLILSISHLLRIYLSIYLPVYSSHSIYRYFHYLSI